MCCFKCDEESGQVSPWEALSKSPAFIQKSSMRAEKTVQGSLSRCESADVVRVKGNGKERDKRTAECPAVHYRRGGAEGRARAAPHPITHTMFNCYTKGLQLQHVSRDNLNVQIYNNNNNNNNLFCESIAVILMFSEGHIKKCQCVSICWN